MARASWVQVTAHEQDCLYLPWRKVGWGEFEQTFKVQAVTARAHTTESQVRMKGLWFLMKSNRRQGATN